MTDSYSYNATHGRLSSQTTTTSGGSSLKATQNWTYDTSLGLLKTHDHPRTAGTFTETLSYDAGLPTSLTAGGQTVVSSATYQPSGSLASYTTGNGVVTTITADASGLPRPGRISASVGSFDTGIYKYDGAGNIVQMGSDQYGYDLMSRLTSSSLSAIGSEGYTYDQYGNLLTRGATTFCTTTCTNNKIAGTGYAYDLRGNMTGTPGQVLTWDGLDRQTQDQTGGVTWKYVYTGDDERVAKAPVSGSWTYTFRDESNRVSTEYVGATLGRDNIYLGNLLVGSFVSSTLSGTLGWQYYASDHLGTPRLVTDPAGAVVETRKYWPFGGEASAPVSPQRMRFATMERDLENNHFNDHARHHDFNLGRFVSPDTVGGKVGFPQTWNRYRYADSNPVRLVDQDGKASILATAFFGGVVTAGIQVGRNYFTSPQPDVARSVLQRNVWTAFVEGAKVGAGLGVAGFFFGNAVKAVAAGGVAAVEAYNQSKEKGASEQQSVTNSGIMALVAGGSSGIGSAVDAVSEGSIGSGLVAGGVIADKGIIKAFTTAFLHLTDQIQDGVVPRDDQQQPTKKDDGCAPGTPCWDALHRKPND